MFDLFAVDASHDPGGKTVLPVPEGWVGSAVFGGPRDCYRYRLAYRKVGIPACQRRAILFSMMNCSMAGPKQMDPTVFKVWKIGSALGFDTVMIGNGHALRMTDQTRVKEFADPTGPENDKHLLDMARDAEMVVMAYGTPKDKAMLPRGPEVARMFLAAGIKLHALRVSKAGRPWHPLYLPDDSVPAPWAGPDVELSHA